VSSAPSFSDAVRARALNALIVSNFLMWGGFFLIVPLLSVHYVAGLGWSAGAIGTVLAVRQLTQQGLTVFGGALSDRLGARGLILAGLAVRALGFALMGQAGSFWTLMAASLVAGVGGALFDAPKNAAVTTLTTAESRSRVFSLMGVAGNLGMVVGPLAGALVSRAGFATVALVAGAVYLVAFAIVALTLPDSRSRATVATTGAATDAGSGSGLAGLGVVVRDRAFVTFTAFAAGYFVLSTQLNVAVTLRATELHGVDAVGWVYGVNAGLAVLLQYPLLRLAERHFSTKRILVGGVALVTLGLGGLAFAGTFVALLACVAVFSLGAMLTFPTQQTLTARLARRGLYGAYFGFGALSLGVGGAVGNAIGGLLYDAGAALGQPALPWLSFAALGTLTALGLAWRLRVLPPEPVGKS
jgi:DHA1 family multidrug resistance protein-like MFS transporter